MDEQRGGDVEVKRLRVIRPLTAERSQRPSTPVRARTSPLEPRRNQRQKVDEAIAKLAGTNVETDMFNILVLNYTMRCPLSCDYCCYGCSPKRDETMSLDLALDLVDQAAELGVFTQCGFTGGEPLIFRDDVLKITERMQKRGLPFSMISSCYWASTRAEAESVIGDLARNGLAVFTATHDDSHGNWVPPEWIRHAVEAALSHGVHVCLTSSFYDDTKRLENIFPEYVGLDVDYVNRVVLPNVGRTKKQQITPADYPNASAGAEGTCYKRIYHDITVFWDGEVYPCCSIYNRDTPRISVGNAYRDSLATMWDRAEGSLWLRAIKRGGFAELYELLRKLDPELASALPDPKRHVGPCDLCHSIFADAKLADRVFATIEQYETTRIRELLAAVRAHNQQAGTSLVETVLKETMQ